MNIAAVLLAAALAQIARVEAIPFQTDTRTDQEFLTGAREGKPATIAGVLRITRRGNDKLPAVILIHGSGGPSGYIDDWALVLNSLGISTLQVDSFTGRGLSNVINDQSLLPRLAQTDDAYRALALLSAHPRIDPKRIALMGFSRGGGAVLYGAMKRLQKMHLPSGTQFAGYVVFYPNCTTTYIDDTDLDDKPIRIFHGAADDWNPVAPCVAYVDRLRKAGKDVVLTTYPGAVHNFDSKILKAPEKFPQGQTPRNCRLHEEAGGRIVTEKGEPFTWSNSCVQRGTTIAYDPDARAKAQQAVTQFLVNLLKPD